MEMEYIIIRIIIFFIKENIYLIMLMGMDYAFIKMEQSMKEKLKII